MEQREKLKPKLVPEHEGTYINMQRLIQVQGEHVVTGVPARYVMRLIDELNAAKQRERVLREALEKFPKSDQPNAEGDCVHGEEWQLCDGCKYAWEQAVADWISTRNAALATPSPEQPAAERIAVQQERIAALEGMLAENKRVLELAMATVARLSAPVSDAELTPHLLGKKWPIAEAFDALIAARATPPAPQDTEKDGEESQTAIDAVSEAQ